MKNKAGDLFLKLRNKTCVPRWDVDRQNVGRCVYYTRGSCRRERVKCPFRGKADFELLLRAVPGGYATCTPGPIKADGMGVIYDRREQGDHRHTYAVSVRA